MEGSRSGVRDMSFCSRKGEVRLVRDYLWTLWKLGEEGIKRRTGMATSASTGTAGSIADGGMVPVKENFGYGLQKCLSSQ